VKLRLEFSKCPMISMYKQSGSTCGQELKFDLYETEMLIYVLCERVLPDFDYKVGRGIPDELMNAKYVKLDYLRQAVLRQLEHTRNISRDNIVALQDPRKPSGSYVLNKVAMQLAKHWYYSRGLYNFDTVSVLTSEISHRAYIGLYHRSGCNMGQAIWFSLFEAPWIIISLINLYVEACQKFVRI
jgi:hypothetical protein